MADFAGIPRLDRLSNQELLLTLQRLQLTGGGSGTVTSINVSGGATGLTFSGGPVTTTGTITLSGTLDIANGGTGQTTSTLSFNAISPLTTRGDLLTRDTTNNIRLAKGATGKFLTTDANDVIWSTATLPSTATGTGTILRADGTNWVATTNTYPNTTANSQILYATSANVIGTNSNFIFNGTNFCVGGAGPVLTEIISTQASVNGVTFNLIKNSSSGSAARSDHYFYNNNNVGLIMGVSSSGHTGTGAIIANGVHFLSTGAPGIGISASESTSGIRFYTGGAADANERIRIISSGNTGFGVTSPTAVLHLKAGTATANTGPLKFTSGTNLTTAEAGTMEYNGTNLFFTRAGTTREGVLTQSAVTTEVIVSDTSVTVNIGGTTYKLLARA